MKKFIIVLLAFLLTGCNAVISDAKASSSSFDLTIDSKDLYAQWECNKTHIVFDINTDIEGATSGNPSEIDAEVDVVLPAIVGGPGESYFLPECPDYKFEGYFDDAGKQ